MPANRGIVVFSGGSAANNLVDVFDAVRNSKSCPLSYIIPISDNGGSSSELIRVFGGPGIGDVRSRLVRLIPESPPSAERSAISALFNHRLSPTSGTEAETEWQSIVAGTSPLWHAISSAKTQLIRSFFNLVNLEILQRSRPPTSTFDFTSASIGNLFLTGARLFSGSFESAIYLLGSLCGIPDNLVRVIPSINSNFSHHIAAGLANGDVIVGQNSISHPSISTALESTSRPNSPTTLRIRLSVTGDPDVEDANLPGTLPTLRTRNIKFSKAHDEDLPARIERIWYINPYGQEMSPPANPRALEAIRDGQAIVYSIGSLYTSIIPSIVLRGIGEALCATQARHKILILNGSLDREVGPMAHPFSAFDFVEAIARAGEESQGHAWSGTQHHQQYHHHHPSGSQDPRFRPTLVHSRSETCLKGSPPSQPPAGAGTPFRYTNGLGDPPPSPSLSPSASLYRKYVTHVIHLNGAGTPAVDRSQLSALGIDCLRVYGRKIEVAGPAGAATPVPAVVGLGMRYDAQALVGAIEAILGRKGDAMANSKSRRNTLDA